LLITSPGWWLLVWMALLLRAVAAWATAAYVLRDPRSVRRWWLIPLQDLLSFIFWVAGFFGNSIVWRGGRYRLDPDGRLQ